MIVILRKYKFGGRMTKHFLKCPYKALKKLFKQLIHNKQKFVLRKYK